MMPDDLADDEVQEFPGEFGIEIGLLREPFEPFDLLRFARRIGGRQVVFGLEATHRLGVLEPFGERIDENRVEPVDRTRDGP